MLRKTLVTLVSVAALGLGSVAMAAHGGGVVASVLAGQL